ncbi:MAG: hypothetical protein ACU0CI_06465, partial [Shimia sp.]
MSIRTQRLVGFCTAIGLSLGSTAIADTQQSISFEAMEFERHCLLPIKQGVALSPDLPSAGKDSWALSDDLIMSAIGNRSGSRGCKFGPSLGV